MVFVVYVRFEGRIYVGMCLKHAKYVSKYHFLRKPSKSVGIKLVTRLFCITNWGIQLTVQTKTLRPNLKHKDTLIALT